MSVTFGFSQILERAERASRRTSMGGARNSLGGDHLDNNYKNNLPITEDANGVPGVPGAESV